MKYLFALYPGKEWSPTEFRDQFELLRNKDLLDTKADNLLWVAHSSLKHLL